MKNKIIWLVLFCITIFAFYLRIYKVPNIPSGIFADEASIGYNAYTLINYRTDEYGNELPILFENFGGTFYRPGIPIYFTSIFVKIFGLNEFSLRLSSVIIGTLTVLLVFFLSKTLFSSKIVGLLSSFFLAISPWHIHFSRINQEFIYLAFFLTLNIYLFILSIRKKSFKLLILNFFVFGLSLYTYVTAYFLIPLFLFSLIFLYRKEFFSIKKKLLIGLTIFFIMSLPLLVGLKSGKILSRFIQISSATKEKTSEQILIGVLNTYKDHFSFEFLFEKGDIGYHSHFITRFSVRGIGELYWFQLPLIISGLLFLFAKFRKGFFVILIWLLLYPLGSTMAAFADGGGPFATRSIIGVLPFQILTAIGTTYFFQIIKSRIFKIIVCFLLVITIFISFKDYLHRYFIQYPLYSSNFWGWQFGARDIVKYFVVNEKNYDELFMAPEFNAPDIFFKFYAPNKCQKCRVGLPNDFYNPQRKQLFAVSPSYLNLNPKLNFKTLKIIYYPNSKIAFLIGKVLE